MNVTDVRGHWEDPRKGMTVKVVGDSGDTIKGESIVDSLINRIKHQLVVLENLTLGLNYSLVSVLETADAIRENESGESPQRVEPKLQTDLEEILSRINHGIDNIEDLRNRLIL